MLLQYVNKDQLGRWSFETRVLWERHRLAMGRIPVEDHPSFDCDGQRGGKCRCGDFITSQSAYLVEHWLRRELERRENAR
jgi:hypothetical protein